MARRSFELRFIEERRGRWVVHKQVDRHRLHLCWPNKDRVEADISAFLRLRASGFDLVGLAKRCASGTPLDLVENLGPSGSIPFRQFVTSVLPKLRNRRDIQREKLAGWRREKQRFAQICRLAPFADRPLHEIREADIRDWLDPYEATVNTSNTRHKMRLAIRTVFAAAVAEGYLLRNPSLRIKLPAIEPARRSGCTLQDVARACGIVSADLRARLLLGAYAGLEPFEQARLRVGDVDLKTRRLTLIGLKPKRTSRRMWIHDALLIALARISKGPPGKLLFAGKFGKSVSYPYRQLKRACIEASVSPFTPLHLRDLFKRLLKRCSPDSDLREWLLGHSLPGLRKYYDGDEDPFEPETVTKAIIGLPSPPVLPTAGLQAVQSQGINARVPCGRGTPASGRFMEAGESSEVEKVGPKVATGGEA